MSRLPLVSPLERGLFLKAQPYLDGLPPRVLVVLASYSRERFYRSGESVQAPGQAIEDILFLGRGEVAVEGDLSQGTGRRHQDRLVDAPGAIGLAHHFAGTPRPPEVRAVRDTLGLALPVDELDQILEDHFSLLLQFTETTCIQAIRALQALGADRCDEAGFDRELRQATPTQLDLVQLLARMRKAPLFRNVNLPVLAEMIRGQEPRVLAAGERLWSAGDPVDRLVFVIDGRFESEGEFGQVGAGSGATLGAWELMTSESRFEDWRATRASRVVSIPKELFADLLEDHHEFALDYLGRVSNKLVEAWNRLAARESAQGEQHA